MSVSRDRGLGVQSREFAGDSFIHMAFGKLGRHANRVLDSVGVRRAMRDKTNALHSEQRGSAVFGVVEAFFKIRKCIAREKSADLARDGAFQSFFQNRADEPG